MIGLLAATDVAIGDILHQAILHLIVLLELPYLLL